MNKLLKRYNRLENNNDHNDCALLLVKNFGTQDEIDTIKSIIIKHERRGHILQEEIDERYAVSQKYYKLLHTLS